MNILYNGAVCGMWEVCISEHTCNKCQLHSAGYKMDDKIMRATKLEEMTKEMLRVKTPEQLRKIYDEIQKHVSASFGLNVTVFDVIERYDVILCLDETGKCLLGISRERYIEIIDRLKAEGAL